MHCELLVPGLFAAAQGARLPAAELIVARGRRSGADPLPLERWLAARFGIEGHLPAGALTLLGSGGNPQGAAWARADPVHLRVMRDRISIVPSDAFSIAREEAIALSEALNRHFAGRLAFDPVEPGRWCVRLAEAAALEETSTLEVAGADLSPGRAGEVLANEVQMLLHGHAVNEAREARGEPAINGVWLWGAGDLPRLERSPWHGVSADDPLVRGLARAAGVRAQPLAASAPSWLAASPDDGRHLLVLDDLRLPLALGDQETAARRLLDLEAQWLEPLLGAVKSGRAGMVTVHVPDAGISFELIRGDLRRFWRRARALATMLP